MEIAARPQTRLAAAVLAAGVVAAVSAVHTPGHELSPAPRNVAVQSSSLITDALYGVGAVVGSATEAVELSVDMVTSLPFNALYAIAAAGQDPAAIPSLLSYVAQLYLNPGSVYPYVTYPWLFTWGVIQPLTDLLPSPMGSSISSLVSFFGDVVGMVFSIFPNPANGAALLARVPYESAVGGALSTGQLAISTAVHLIADTLQYLGYLPARVESSIEAAIGNLIGGVFQPAASVAATREVSALPSAAATAITLNTPIARPTEKSTSSQTDGAEVKDATDTKHPANHPVVVGEKSTTPNAPAAAVVDGSYGATEVIPDLGNAKGSLMPGLRGGASGAADAVGKATAPRLAKTKDGSSTRGRHVSPKKVGESHAGAA
ncbi:MAG TPA: hypothetical protein VFW21_00230 [Mycobacterium sp.]|nr:hypothetical protein [Mycobacterium sp.]